MRGEHWMPVATSNPAPGSSPHARGSRSRQDDSHGVRGIILARAGNTIITSSTTFCGRDHPRMRGEHLIGRTGKASHGGSSPHARGTPTSRATARTTSGIIPACAGNTECPLRRKGFPWDHPRMRREHAVFQPSAIRSSGSSPHARGTHDGELLARAWVGIIPACAGNTPFSASLRPSRRDHPRMRGEHHVIHAQHVRVSGSSPHARGTLSEHVHLEPRVGIIPACAGNTSPSSSPSSSSEDHPRMRGEHDAHPPAFVPELGSSPHARGTHYNNTFYGGRDGIIPACAGNTEGQGRLQRPHGDHPRMRGEHDERAVAARHDRGSPPHARGTRLVLHRQYLAAGIIPACAGNTGT